MPSLAQIAQNSATISVSWGGIEWTATYRPGALTDANLALIDGGFEQTNQAVVAMLAAWNLTERDEVTPFPLDVTRLGEVPYLLKIALLQAAVRDARPN